MSRSAFLLLVAVVGAVDAAVAQIPAVEQRKKARYCSSLISVCHQHHALHQPMQIDSDWQSTIDEIEGGAWHDLVCKVDDARLVKQKAQSVGERDRAGLVGQQVCRDTHCTLGVIEVASEVVEASSPEQVENKIVSVLQHRLTSCSVGRCIRLCKLIKDVFEQVFVILEGIRTVFAKLFVSGIQLLPRAALLIVDQKTRVYHPQEREYELVDNAQVALLFVDLSSVLAK